MSLVLISFVLVMTSAATSARSDHLQGYNNHRIHNIGVADDIYQIIANGSNNNHNLDENGSEYMVDGTRGNNGNRIELKHTGGNKSAGTILKAVSISNMEKIMDIRCGGKRKESKVVSESSVSQSKLRDAVFPIYGKDEIQKFSMLGLVKFFIIIALTLTRDTKDTLIVTQCGAEAISFLKIYGVLPAAIIFTALYGKASNVLGESKATLFNITCIPFFLFFIAYDLLIRPNLGSLEPSEDALRSYFGQSLSPVVLNILSHWTSALFFVVAEIYSSVSIGILFWKTANDFVTPKEAQRFYPLFAYTSGFAPIFAGQYMSKFASLASTFDGSMRRITYAISFSGLMILTLNHIICDKYGQVDTKGAAVTSNQVKKKKKKMNMSESVAFLASSKYLRHLATMVVSYGLMYNFCEISWKSLLKKKYPEALDYQRFMGNFSSTVGASTFFVIFGGSNLLKHLGWRIGALCTPFVMFILAIPFFASLVFFDLENNPVVVQTGVAIGTTLILLSRSFKYGMFDATTQMAYIPLDEESKVKGKAAIDVLGSRLGKSGASLIQQGLILKFGNILSAAPIVMVCYNVIALGWLHSVVKLSVLYQGMIGSEDKQNKKLK